MQLCSYYSIINNYTYYHCIRVLWSKQCASGGEGLEKHAILQKYSPRQQE